MAFYALKRISRLERFVSPDWVLGGVQGHWTGDYETAEEALGELQKAVEGAD